MQSPPVKKLRPILPCDFVTITTKGDGRCFVCDRNCPTTGEKWPQISDIRTRRSNTELLHKIAMETDYSLNIIVSGREIVCSQCVTLINRIESLEEELEAKRMELQRKLFQVCTMESDERVQTGVVDEGKPPSGCETRKNTKHKAFACSICKKILPSKATLANHKNKEHLSKWNCQFCYLIFSDGDALNRHMQTHLKSAKIPNIT